MLNFLGIRRERKKQLIPAHVGDAMPRLTRVLRHEIAVLDKLVQEPKKMEEERDESFSAEERTMAFSDGTEQDTLSVIKDPDLFQRYDSRSVGKVLAAASDVHLKLKLDKFSRQNFALIRYLRPFSRSDETFGESVREITERMRVDKASEMQFAACIELRNLYVYLLSRIYEVSG